MGQVQNKQTENDNSCCNQEYISTKFMLDMLMNHKLRHAGFHADVPNNKEYKQVFNALLKRSTDVERIFMSQSNAALDIGVLLNSQQHLVATLEGILQQSEHTWGAVFAIFALAGMIFDYLIEKRQLNKMYLVIDNLHRYMSLNKVDTWIDEKGGWSMFPENSQNDY